jgi:hypothetical protein
VTSWGVSNSTIIQMNNYKIMIIVLFVFTNTISFAQNDNYKDLIDDDKPVEAALSFFKKDSLSEINIYGNFSDRNLLIYSSKKDVMDSIRNGNIGLLLGLANTKHLTGLDLAFSDIDESKIKEAKEAFYYFKIISVFSSEKENLKDIIYGAHYSLGFIYSGNLLFDRKDDYAIEHFEKALSEPSLKGSCLINLAYICKNNNNPKAEEYYNELLNWGKEDYYTAYSIALAIDSSRYGFNKNIFRLWYWKYKAQQLKKKRTR